MSAVLEEEPSTLRDGWYWTTMGEIAEVVGGGTPRTNDPTNFEGGDVPWITPADLSGYMEKYISHGARFITRKGLESSSARLIPAGTVLFTSRAPIGYVAIAQNPVATNQGFKSFVLKAGVLPEYVYWWLKGSKQRAEALASGTTFLELSGANAKKLPIPIAPIDEQRRIVAEIEKQFSRIDETVANLQRVKANLKHYKAAVFKAAVDGRLVAAEADLAARDGRRFETGAQFLERVLRARSQNWAGKGRHRVPLEPSNESLPVVPPGWSRATWDQLSHWVTYGFTRPMPHVPTGVPIVTARHIGNGRIDFRDVDFTPDASFEELSEKDRPRVGDILITKDGAIGRAAVVETDKPFCINQSVAVVWLRSLTADPRYLLLVIEGPAVQKRIREKARGVAIQHLSITDLAAMTLPLPPLAEQNRIVAEVDRRLSIVREVEAEVDANLKRAQVLRQAVLARSFSGEPLDGKAALDLRATALANGA